MRDVFQDLKEGMEVEINYAGTIVRGEIGEKTSDAFYIWQNELDGVRGHNLPATKGYKYSWTASGKADYEIRILNSSINNGGSKMAERVISDMVGKVYGKDTLEDALIVSKYMTPEDLGSGYTAELHLMEHKDKVLEEAKRRKKVSEEEKK